MLDSDIGAIFLATLESMAKASPTKDSFAAVEINAIGSNLGLADTDTLQLLRQLDAADRIVVQWGGEIKLLPRKDTKSVRLGKGAVYVGEGAQIGSGAAIGQYAMAAGSTRNSQSTSATQIQAIADLTAAIVLLAQYVTASESEPQADLKKLIEETRAVLPELRSATPDKGKLKDRLDIVDKATGIVSKTVTIASATVPASPLVLDLLHKGWLGISTFLGT